MEYVNPEDKEVITLQQTITALPDMTNAQQIIDREKSAATSIISYAIDFTRELREKVSNICEASSYRTYADMKGTFEFIVNCSKQGGEVIVKIIYFVSDLRVRWHTSLQVNISDDGKTAEVEGFIIVDNKTGFSYENVELGFAIFELPSAPAYATTGYGGPPEATAQEAAFPAALRQEMLGELDRLRSVQPKSGLKRTQRMKNLML